MEKKKLRININIDGKSYPLTINFEDEERYRTAAKKVNEIVRKYREQFSEQDSKDIIAMAAFQIALSNTELEHREDKTLFIEELKNLNDDISDFLKEKRKK
ncbi:MAG TPA: cell division protein ZapA [Draconibacterium sp.]|nr:cell division protein ZapA [Draconibacterium sp.]